MCHPSTVILNRIYQSSTIPVAKTVRIRFRMPFRALIDRFDRFQTDSGTLHSFCHIIARTLNESVCLLLYDAKTSTTSQKQAKKCFIDNRRSICRCFTSFVAVINRLHQLLHLQKPHTKPFCLKKPIESLYNIAIIIQASATICRSRQKQRCSMASLLHES